MRYVVAPLWPGLEDAFLRPPEFYGPGWMPPPPSAALLRTLRGQRVPDIAAHPVDWTQPHLVLAFVGEAVESAFVLTYAPPPAPLAGVRWRAVMSDNPDFARPSRALLRDLERQFELDGIVLTGPMQEGPFLWDVPWLVVLSLSSEAQLRGGSPALQRQILQARKELGFFDSFGAPRSSGARPVSPQSHPSTTGVLRRCKSTDLRPQDRKEGRVWCIYRHDPHDHTKPAARQGRGWPRRFTSEAAAKRGLQMMQYYKHTGGRSTEAGGLVGGERVFTPLSMRELLHPHDTAASLFTRRFELRKRLGLGGLARIECGALVIDMLIEAELATPETVEVWTKLRSLVLTQPEKLCSYRPLDEGWAEWVARQGIQVKWDVDPAVSLMRFWLHLSYYVVCNPSAELNTSEKMLVPSHSGRTRVRTFRPGTLWQDYTLEKLVGLGAYAYAATNLLRTRYADRVAREGLREAYRALNEDDPGQQWYHSPETHRREAEFMEMWQRRCQARMAVADAATLTPFDLQG